MVADDPEGEAVVEGAVHAEAAHGAVVAALVAEVFPKEARERAGGIFHATSVAGLWLAAAAGLWVGTEWRTAYLLGVAPALLVLWVRMSIKEPESWKAARESKTERMGSFSELLGDPRWRARAIFGAMLAMVGLATFWGVVVAGQDIAADFLKRANDPDWASKSKIAFGFIQTAGAGAGMLAFGPLAARWGCKKTFVIMHIAALIMTPIVCWLPSQVNSYAVLLVLLPLFGFFAQGSPCVASALSGTVEMLGEKNGGALYASSTPEWIEKLTQLVRDAALRRKMGASGRARFEQHYTAEAVARTLAARMRELAAPRS